MKDSIDFGSMDISTLFRKLLVPTVLGMVFSAIFVITDGIFVGKGIGSDALAAVNITASGITRRRWVCIFLPTPLDWRVVILRYTDMFSTPIHRLTHLDWIVTK